MKLPKEVTETNKHSAEEVVEVWKVGYALINFDGKTRCAWCKKETTEIKDVNDHISAHDHTQKVHEKKMKKALQQQREEVLREVMWLIDCEEDCMESAGDDTLFIKNLRNRFVGQFKKSLSVNKKV